MMVERDAIVRRVYADLQALAEPRRVSASRTREYFRRGGVLGPQGFRTGYLDLVVDQGKMRYYERTGELSAALECLNLVGLMDGQNLTSLGEALLPVLSHEGMSSQFVWYVLWINLSCTWLGAMSWNMLTRQGPTVPFLVEPLCSYLCGEEILDSLDRGTASSLEDSFRNTPWGQLGVGGVPAYGRRLWTRTPPPDVDPLLVLYGLYRASDVSNLLAVDKDQLARLPYGPCMALGIDGLTVERQLLSLWLPGLLAQRREGKRVMFSVPADKDACDVIKEYSRRRGYQ